MVRATISDKASGSSTCLSCSLRYQKANCRNSITVAEMNEPSSDESLAASSVIMPRSVSPPGSAHTTTAQRFSTSSMSFPSAPPSVGSSVSLIDASSDSDDDDAIYEDSRSRVITSPEVAPPDVEYVMLFDSSSEED